MHSISDLIALKNSCGLTFAVVFPCKNEAKTIGNICESILNDSSCTMLLDELLVMNDDSTDNSGVIVDQIFDKYSYSNITCSLYNTKTLTHYKQVPFPKYIGKGAVMWKSLFLIESDIIIFIDSDHETYNLIPKWIIQFITQFLLNPTSLQFVKGYFSKNIKNRNGMSGRVSDLVMLPLLSLLYPNITNNNNSINSNNNNDNGNFNNESIAVHIGCGEQAARKEWLMQIDNFPAHYAIEICLWLEAQIRFGNCQNVSIKQIDLKEKIARKHNTLQLRLMASTIMSYIIKKRFGLFTGSINSSHADANNSLVLGTVLASKMFDEKDRLAEKYENINVDVFPSADSIIRLSLKNKASFAHAHEKDRTHIRASRSVRSVFYNIMNMAIDKRINVYTMFLLVIVLVTTRLLLFHL